MGENGMLHEGHEKAKISTISRWKAERGGLPWGLSPSTGGRTFEEDLALFERQVREEAGQKNGRSAALCPPAALSA
jgi:hypothetical protein